MTLWERVETGMVPAVITAVLGFVGWVVRKVMTNGARVDALEKKLDSVHTDVREIRNVLMNKD